jgi:hypothetical protein
VSEQDDKLALWGTGTFFRRDETLWLITAAHILQEVPLKELAIPPRSAVALPIDAISNANSSESQPDANVPAFRDE